MKIQYKERYNSRNTVTTCFTMIMRLLRVKWTFKDAQYIIETKRKQFISLLLRLRFKRSAQTMLLLNRGVHPQQPWRNR